MTKLTHVNLDKFIEQFSVLEQNITDIDGKNNVLEIELDDVQRRLKFSLTKEKGLIEERDSMLATLNTLQQSVQQQCNLRVENEKLKNNVADLKQQNEITAEHGEAELQRLAAAMNAERDRHKRELEAVRQRCRSELQEAHKQLESKDAEMENLLERKDSELEEMRKSLRNQERERQNELLKLQMERRDEKICQNVIRKRTSVKKMFGIKLAKVQSTAQRSQQQHQQGPGLLPQNIFKRKLQFVQEEKNREIANLRQRIKELEEHQRASGLNDIHLKRRKI